MRIVREILRAAGLQTFHLVGDGPHALDGALRELGAEAPATPWLAKNISLCDLVDSADVHDFCEGIDLLVWLADTLDYRLVYGAARRAGVPVVSAAVGINYGFVGLLVDPRQDACFECIKASERGRSETVSSAEPSVDRVLPLRSSCSVLNLRVAAAVS